MVSQSWNQILMLAHSSYNGLCESFVSFLSFLSGDRDKNFSQSKQKKISQ